MREIELPAFQETKTLSAVLRRGFLFSGRENAYFLSSIFNLTIPILSSRRIFISTKSPGLHL